MTLIKKSLLLMALLAAAVSAKAQSTTTFSVTVVAPPACTVTASTPVSVPGVIKLLAGQAGVVNFNVSACSIASLTTATATWDGTAIVVVAPFAVNVTAAQATLGTHSLVLTIPQPLLTMNDPIQLPNAPMGQAYSADLAAISGLRKNGHPCSTCTFSSANLPSGLTLSASGIVTGTVASSVAGGSFSFNVTDSSPSTAKATPLENYRIGSMSVELLENYKPNSKFRLVLI